jgi:trehalose 6-phosphate phosphatase
MTQHPLGSELRAALRLAAGVERLLVATDFDGVLSPIVEEPAAAQALPAALHALRLLTDLPRTDVAVVSGRSLADLASRCPLPSVVQLVGSHGAEFAPPPTGAHDTVGSSPTDTDQTTLAAPLLDAHQARLRAALLEAVAAIAADVPGVLLEPKPGGVAVHVRRASRTDAARVLESLRRGPAALSGVHAMAGKEVLELSVLAVDKGSAIDVLRRRTPVGATVFLGDDVTDETVFTRLGGLDVGIKVGPGLTAAGHRIAGVGDVALVLAHLAADRARP